MKNNNVEYFYYTTQGMAVIFDEYEKLVSCVLIESLPALLEKCPDLKEWTREQEKEYGLYEFSIKRQVEHLQMSL